MPMKYSTLRSKRCAPSRWSRMAAFVSGVIQLSRPISSSGPHGLADTLRPSISCRASGTSSWSCAMRSPPQGWSAGNDFGVSRQRAVELGSPVAEQVHLVLARRGDDRLVPRPLDVDVREEQGLARRVRLGEPGPGGIDDLAATAELGRPLSPDAVRHEQ